MSEFHFHNHFSEALRIKAEEGVFIRLIVDSEYMFVTGSKVPQLAAAGVDFIHDKTTGIFHHKIAIGTGLLLSDSKNRLFLTCGDRKSSKSGPF